MRSPAMAARSAFAAADADEVAELVRTQGERAGLGERGEREHFGGVRGGERDEIAGGRREARGRPDHLQHGRAFDELPVRREMIAGGASRQTAAISPAAKSSASDA